MNTGWCGRDSTAFLAGHVVFLVEQLSLSNGATNLLLGTASIEAS